MTPFGTIDVNATGGDGVITLLLAAVALVGALAGNRWLFGTPMIIASAVCAYDATNLARTVEDEELVAIDIGAGLALALVGAIGGVVVAVAWRSAAAPRTWPAGWYADGPLYRYWDGRAWTGHTAGGTAVRGDAHHPGSSPWPPPAPTMPAGGVASSRGDLRPPPPRRPDPPTATSGDGGSGG